MPRTAHLDGTPRDPLVADHEETVHKQPLDNDVKIEQQRGEKYDGTRELPMKTTTKNELDE